MNLGDQLVPKNFIVDIEEDRKYDLALQEYDLTFNRSAGENWHQSTDRILSYPDLQERIEQWRIDNVMSPDFKEECYQSPHSEEQGNLLIIPETDTTNRQTKKSSIIQNNITTSGSKPKHSVANTIFRKRKVKLQIFDNGLVEDGDRVAIIVNGGLYFPNLTLSRFPGTTIDIYLRPSALMPGRANSLLIWPMSGGRRPLSLLEPKVTVGINVLDADLIFQGSFIKSHPAAVEVALSVPAQAPQPLLFGVGLACIGFSHPQSRLHALIATGDNRVDCQGVNQPRILTVDRLFASSRRKSSIRKYEESCPQPKKPGEQYDEYPPAVFRENFGLAHVMPIRGGDNQGSGAAIGIAINNPFYRDGDQIEIVIPDNRLFCRDAF